VNEWLRIAKRFIISIILGLFLSIIFLQNSKQSHSYVLQIIKKQCHDQMDCDFSARIHSIDFFKFKIVFHDMVIHPLTGDMSWSLESDIFILSCSLWNIFKNWTLDLFLEFEGLHANSLSNGYDLALFSYIWNLFSIYEAQTPIIIRTVKIDNGFLYANAAQGYEANIWFNGTFEDNGGDSSACIYMSKSKIFSKHQKYLEDLEGTIRLFADDSWHIFSDIGFKNYYSDTHDNIYFFKGLWEHGKGTWSLSTLNGTCMFNDTIIEYDDSEYHIQLKGEFESCLINPMIGTHRIANIAADGVYRLKDWRLLDANFKIDLKHIETTHGTIDLIDADCRFDNKGFDGKFIAQKNEYSINGYWKWDTNNKFGSIEFFNTSKTAFPQSYWVIPPGKLKALCTFNDTSVCNAQLDCVWEHERFDASIESTARLEVENSVFDLEGEVGSYHFVAKGVNQFPFIKNIEVHDGDEQLITAISNQDSISCTVDYAIIYQLLPEMLKKHAVGQGHFCFDGKSTSDGIIGTLELHDGIIHVPFTDNFIDALKVDLSFEKTISKLVFSDLFIGFHHGAITSSRIVCLLNQLGKPVFIHAPLIIDNCFINWAHHCSAIISGSLNISQQKEQPSFAGTLFIDEANINQSLLNEIMKKMSSAEPLLLMPLGVQPFLDLKCISRKPLAFNTIFCKTTCMIDSHITGSLNNPEISGAIVLRGGSLNFPYKPLEITKGRINFTGQKWSDAIIEFYAKNRIKRYMIDMHFSGLISNPQISFMAHPNLSTEQILSLLLNGSEKGNLSSTMPAIVLNNAYSWLLHGEDEGQETFFKKLMDSLHSVHFVPTVSKKGVKGALEINVSDDFHATIAKDFSNRQQTSLELEYQLNNALSIRGRRDERGDVGADVELRWKF
jgi:TamB, inner membrane protein subunit of TAM complex